LRRLSGSSGNIVEKNDCYKARLAGIELSIDTGRPPFGSVKTLFDITWFIDDGTHGIFTNYDPSQHNRILHKPDLQPSANTLRSRDRASWRIIARNGLHQGTKSRENNTIVSFTGRKFAAEMPSPM